MMTTENKESEFLFVPIISAVLLILVVTALVWLNQVGPSVQASTETESSEAVEQESGQVTQPLAGDPAVGQELFAGTCAACHGPQGEGIPGLGKDMTTSQFIAGKTDQELIDFIKVGRDPSDPLNTTGVAMPPKGGNPALSDQDLADIVAFIRTIHK
jgi:mono/diheme cytochrome c family protein